MTNAGLIEIIDGFLRELGTTGLVDARKARDQLMDLRLLLMLDATDPLPVPLIADPALVTEIIRP